VRIWRGLFLKNAADFLNVIVKQTNKINRTENKAIAIYLQRHAANIQRIVYACRNPIVAKAREIDSTTPYVRRYCLLGHAGENRSRTHP
jgi:hypothetical protein